MDKLIEQMQEYIFEYKMSQFEAILPQFIEQLLNRFTNEDPVFITNLNIILNAFNNALENKDFLLAADYLEYEAKPMLCASCDGRNSR